MTTRLLFRHFDQDVWFMDISTPSDLDYPFIDTATMLLVIGDDVPASERHALFDVIARREPIAVVIAAAEARAAWEELADRVYQRGDGYKLTMAFSCDDPSVDDRVDALLSTFKPGDDRWDEWDRYIIAGWGLNMTPYITDAVERFAKPARGS